MNQVPVEKQQIPAYYDEGYLNDLFDASGHTVISLAVETGHSPTTISEALNGKSKKINVLFGINRKLNGDWPRLFTLSSRPRVRRAARRQQNGGGAVSDRSTGGVGRSKHR